MKITVKNVTPTPAAKVTCGFCGKSSQDVAHVVVAATDSSICDECVWVCVEIILARDGTPEGFVQAAIQVSDLMQFIKAKSFRLRGLSTTATTMTDSTTNTETTK